MSRRTFKAQSPTGPLQVTELVGGWDRALQEWFVQAKCGDDVVFSSGGRSLDRLLVEAEDCAGILLPVEMLDMLSQDGQANTGNELSEHGPVCFALPT